MIFGPVDKKKLASIDFTLPGDGVQTHAALKGVRVAEFEAFVISPKWGTKDWTGLLYAEQSKAKDFLELYAHHFSHIELNATFYTMPDAQRLKIWAESVGHNPDFIFIPKVPRDISHIKRLKNIEVELQDFLLALKGFGKHLGPVLLQLSDSFNVSQFQDLEVFLKAIPADVKLFVEVRNQQWFSDDQIRRRFFSLLAALKMGTVMTDSAGRRDCLHMELTTPEVYIRFIGYGHQFLELDKKRIDLWVERLFIWKDKGLETIYFVVHQEKDDDAILLLSEYIINKFNDVLGAKIPKLKFIKDGTI